MKAIFQVKFKASDMIDKETFEKEYGSDWMKLMKYLYKEEGFGIFAEKLKLVAVKRG
jgi:hypothetical protein